MPLHEQCSKCTHWRASDRERAVVAPCALRRIPWPEFWQGCRSFVSVETAAAAQAEDAALQSQCRGADPQAFMGVKVVQP